MSTVTAPGFTSSKPKSNTIVAAKVLSWVAIVGLAVFFVIQYALPYFLNYGEAQFTSVVPNYWPLRAWLLLHIGGGMLALLSGPFQFWSGLRKRHLQLHRWTGRLFLFGVVIGSIGAFRMAAGTVLGWSFGVSLVTLAVYWLSTTGMAYYAIRRRRIDVHKEWMIRAYVITFAFVLFRILNDYSPLARLEPVTDRLTTIAWVCWTVPLLVTEIVLQFRRSRWS